MQYSKSRMHVAIKEHRSSSPANQLAVISIEPLYRHSVSTEEIIVLEAVVSYNENVKLLILAVRFVRAGSVRFLVVGNLVPSFVLSFLLSCLGRIERCLGFMKFQP
ncbi:hypothetical protein F511_28135 [Dorcoceras hygrometricum]|uniref:Uncharacterized protein n=1 Tax=Dorcoceras hygrometricum TaxID=472368 RepID=A0A2Z7BJI1_9LAMI|nr:hypothetical protein F511_28135 [Dorcoceras hygrometricum]